MSPSSRLLGLLLAGALALAPGLAPPAAAGDPQVAYVAWQVGTEGVAVNGTYAPIVGDFLGEPNGFDDIIWYAPGASTDHLWQSTGDVDAPFTSQHLPRQVSGTYTPIVGNFGGDARDDIIWYAPGAGADSLWVSDGTSFSTQALSVNGTYVPAVLRDDSGLDDLIWANPNGGTGVLWTFTGAIITSRSVTSPAGSRPLTGRFNDGGCADVFWYAPGPTVDEAWYLNCAGVVGATAAEPVAGAYEAVVVDRVGPGANDGILWFRDGLPSTFWEGDDVGTWKPDVYPSTVDGTPVVAGVWVHLRSAAPTGDELLEFPGHPDAAVIDAGTDPLAAAHRPVVGRFVSGETNTRDILWYAPGATAERLFWVALLA